MNSPFVSVDNKASQPSTSAMKITNHHEAFSKMTVQKKVTGDYAKSITGDTEEEGRDSTKQQVILDPKRESNRRNAARFRQRRKENWRRLNEELSEVTAKLEEARRNSIVLKMQVKLLLQLNDNLSKQVGKVTGVAAPAPPMALTPILLRNRALLDESISIQSLPPSLRLQLRNDLYKNLTRAASSLQKPSSNLNFRPL